MIGGVGGLLEKLGLGDVAGMVGLGPNPGLADMQQAMADAKADYAAYRPEMWAARMGALQKSMDLFQPVNAKMGELYGTDAQLPLDAAFQYDYSTPAPGAVATQQQALAKTQQQPGFAGIAQRHLK